MNGPEEMSATVEDLVDDCKLAYAQRSASQLSTSVEALRRVIAEVSQEIKSSGIQKLMKGIASEVIPMMRIWEAELAKWEAEDNAARMQNENPKAVAC